MQLRRLPTYRHVILAMSMLLVVAAFVSPNPTEAVVNTRFYAHRSIHDRTDYEGVYAEIETANPAIRDDSDTYSIVQHWIGSADKYAEVGWRKVAFPGASGQPTMLQMWCTYWVNGQPQEASIMPSFSARMMLIAIVVTLLAWPAGVACRSNDPLATTKPPLQAEVSGAAVPAVKPVIQWSAAKDQRAVAGGPTLTHLGSILAVQSASPIAGAPQPAPNDYLAAFFALFGPDPSARVVPTAGGLVVTDDLGHRYPAKYTGLAERDGLTIGVATATRITPITPGRKTLTLRFAGFDLVRPSGTAALAAQAQLNLVTQVVETPTPGGLSALVAASPTAVNGITVALT